MFKKIVLVLLLVTAVIGVLATRQPDSYAVERRATINAAPEVVFANINDFHRWDAWSPWAKLDPAMQTTHSGAPAGVGAVYTWAGNSDVGEGRMELKQSLPPNEVAIAMHFLKPIDSESVITFQLAPTNAGTEVIWTMRGDANMMSKVMSVFVNMDTMIGPDFEKGLSQLKVVSEAK